MKKFNPRENPETEQVGQEVGKEPMSEYREVLQLFKEAVTRFKKLSEELEETESSLQSKASKLLSLMGDETASTIIKEIKNLLFRRKMILEEFREQEKNLIRIYEHLLQLDMIIENIQNHG